LPYDGKHTAEEAAAGVALTWCVLAECTVAGEVADLVACDGGVDARLPGDGGNAAMVLVADAALTRCVLAGCIVVEAAADAGHAIEVLAAAPAPSADEGAVDVYGIMTVGGDELWYSRADRTRLRRACRARTVRGCARLPLTPCASR
jgi:hypothetical protein